MPRLGGSRAQARAAATQHPRVRSSPDPVPRPGGSRAQARAADKHPLVRSSPAPVSPAAAQHHTAAAEQPAVAAAILQHWQAVPVSLLPKKSTQQLFLHLWEVELRTRIHGQMHGFVVIVIRRLGRSSP